MGWNIKLVSDRDITKKELEEIFDNLPQRLRGWHFGYQRWGWTAAVDIYNPDGNELTLHGSYTQSGQIAEEFANWMSDNLKKLGHKIKIGKMT